MSPLFRDPIWQFVGVVISLIALVVAIVAIRAQQRRKSIGYHFTSDRPILYVFDEALKSRLTLSLDGQPVQGLSTYEFAVFNDGNVPVLPGDYAEPIRLQFADNSRVLAVAVTETHPADLGVKIEAEEEGYRVSPVLLNPRDEFVVQFLVDQENRAHYARPTVRGRIAGVREVAPRKARPASALRMGFYRFVLARSAPVFILGVAASLGAASLVDAVSKVLSLMR
jgi:hypothetical protein